MYHPAISMQGTAPVPPIPAAFGYDSELSMKASFRFKSNSIRGFQALVLAF